MPSLEELMREVERTHEDHVDAASDYWSESSSGPASDAHERMDGAETSFRDACANLRDALGLAPARRDVV